MTRPAGLETIAAPRSDGEARESATSTPRASLLEAYDLWAESYDEPNPLHALEERILRPLLPNLQDKDVLDVACGTGRWLGKLLSRGARAGWGIDLSPGMLARASSRPSLRGRLARADCLTLPLRPEIADLIICSLAASHVNDLGGLARELAQVARHRADLFITDFHPQGHARGWRRTFRHGGEVLEVPSVAHSLAEVRRAFERAGFQFVRGEEPCLGEPEKETFERRGREELFETACESPVIYVFHFKLLGGPPATEQQRLTHTVAAPIATGVPGALNVHKPLRLVGARVAVDASTAIRAELIIENGYVRELIPVHAGLRQGLVSESDEAPRTVDLCGYLILPGLINAHDHLEFNLFPRLGKGPYPNFQRWAQDIYHPHLPPLREHLAVPKAVRLWWGGIKNLLSGATTVCQHNPYDPEVFDKDFPVRVVNRYGWAHSLRVERDVAGLFRSTPPDVPFLIHLGEGTDAESGDEIFELDRLGALDSRTVIVHGVGLTPSGRALLEERGAGLVWCPTANLFTLGTTLDRNSLRRHRRVALGSDSALTAEGDLLDEIRAAHDITGLDDGEIFSMVTSKAAELLRLTRGEGTLRAGAVADLVAIPDFGDLPAAALAKCSFGEIELVVSAGRARLLSASLARRWPKNDQEAFFLLQVGDVERWVRAPVRRLVEETKRHLRGPIRLAGRALELA